VEKRLVYVYINQYLQKEKEKRRAENSTRISEQLMMKSLVHFTAVWNELQAMWVSFINNSNNVYKDKSFFFLSFLGGISLVSSMFLACFKISESFSLPVSCRQIQKLIRAFAANFAAQDVNDVSALPSYGDIDQCLELYYFACF
jgi:hypothetical protein